MKLHPSIMNKRLIARAIQVRKLQTRICQLEIQNYDLREKIKQLSAKPQCPK